MILTFTLNPALDLTYTVEGSLAPGHTHRVQTVQSRPGGKGVNVARVLTSIGESVCALGPGDHDFGSQLAAYEVAADFPHLLDRVRCTVAVVTGDSTTVFNEPGAAIATGAEDELAHLLKRHLAGASVLVISGSLASGLADDLPVRLARSAARLQVPTILDLDDAPLAHAAAAGGSVLMPNEHELARLLGEESMATADVAAAASDLAHRTGAPVIATLGAVGLVAAAGREVWQATPPERVVGNPTGAGDATAAGVALGLARGLAWPDILRHAVALGAAAVRSPVAGEVDLADYRRWIGTATVQKLDPSSPTLLEPRCH